MRVPRLIPIASALMVIATILPAAPAMGAPADPNPGSEQRRCIAIAKRLVELERNLIRLKAERNPELSVGDLMRELKPSEIIAEVCGDRPAAEGRGTPSLAATEGSDAMRRCIAVIHRLTEAERTLARLIAERDPDRSLGDLMRDISPGEAIRAECAGDGGGEGGGDPSTIGLTNRKCIALLQRRAEAERQLARLRAELSPSLSLGDLMRDINIGEDVSEVCARA